MCRVQPYIGPEKYDDKRISQGPAVLLFNFPANFGTIQTSRTERVLSLSAQGYAITAAHLPSALYLYFAGYRSLKRNRRGAGYDRIGRSSLGFRATVWAGIHPHSTRHAHEAESLRFVAGADLLTKNCLFAPAMLLYRNGSDLPIGR